jgi:hypothetical protein
MTLLWNQGVQTKAGIVANRPVVRITEKKYTICMFDRCSNTLTHEYNTKGV